MGKATRIRQQTAREKIAAQQAAARRAENRRKALLAGGSVLVVIAVVVVLIIVKVSSGPSKPSSTKASNQPASVTRDIVTVPASTLNAVGRGDAASLKPVLAASHAAPLTLNGKPEVLFIGAQYCPYCAAERWAIAVALSRFGTLSGLHFIHSSSTDVYPSTPTLTFYKSTYTSKLIDFTPVEWYSEVPDSSSPTGYAVLQAPTAAQLAIFGKLDTPPYVTSQYKGSYPFLDIGNKYLDIGAQYLPSVLAGMTWAQVAAALHDPSSAVAKGADGAANTITAAICKLTGGKPASVCTSAAVTKASGAL
jgi:Domain of unknown function (DUF929)